MEEEQETYYAVVSVAYTGVITSGVIAREIKSGNPGSYVVRFTTEEDCQAYLAYYRAIEPAHNVSPGPEDPVYSVRLFVKYPSDEYLDSYPRCHRVYEISDSCCFYDPAANSPAMVPAPISTRYKVTSKRVKNDYDLLLYAVYRFLLHISKLRRKPALWAACVRRSYLRATPGRLLYLQVNLRSPKFMQDLDRVSASWRSVANGKLHVPVPGSLWHDILALTRELRSHCITINYREVFDK